MKLYHSVLSSNARKVLAVAKLIGADLELVAIDLSKREQHSPEYLAINPNGRVPTLVDGDFTLWESSAIMEYLCDTQPGQTLYPADPRARADVNRWLFWGTGHLSVPVATLNWENMIKGFFAIGAPDASQVERANRLFATYAKVLDAHLAKRQYVCQDALTLADVGLAAPLMYKQAAKLPLGPFEHVQGWYARIDKLPAWQQTKSPLG